MFQVGDIVWHNKYKRGEVAYVAGSDVRVMFDDGQWNPRISTVPAQPPKRADEDEAFRLWLSSEMKKLKLELDEELKNTTLTPEEQIQYRQDKQRQRAREITFEDEANRETVRTSPLDGHVIYWGEGYQPPVTKNGMPDPRYSGPVTPGYFKVNKTIQPIGVYLDKITQEKKYYKKKGLIDLNLSSSKTGAKFLVQISDAGNDELPTARKVPYEELSLLMDDEDSFGGFSVQPKQ